MGRIAFVVQSALTPRNRRRFGIDFAVERGHEVFTFDISRIILPNQPHVAQRPESFTDLKAACVDSPAEFTRVFSRAPSLDLIVFLAQSFGYSRQNSFALRAIATNGAPILISQANIYPGYDSAWSRRTLFQKAASAVARWREVDIANSLFARIPRKLLGIPQATFTVLGGRLSAMPNSLIGAETTPLYGHAGDYDLYLEARAGCGPRKDVAVFLDQFLPFHPGFSEIGAHDWIDPDHYFACLDRLFGKIERELGLAVEIAAHPRADYRDKPGVFGGRRVVYGETARMVGSARLVVSHQSTAVGLAMLFKTPVLPIAYRPHRTVSEHFAYVYDAFSAAVGKPFFFIDDSDLPSLGNALSWDEALCQRYIVNYIKQPQSPEKPLWPLVADALAAAGAPLL